MKIITQCCTSNHYQENCIRDHQSYALIHTRKLNLLGNDKKFLLLSCALVEHNFLSLHSELVKKIGLCKNQEYRNGERNAGNAGNGGNVAKHSGECSQIFRGM